MKKNVFWLMCTILLTILVIGGTCIAMHSQQTNVATGKTFLSQSLRLTPSYEAVQSQQMKFSTSGIRQTIPLVTSQAGNMSSLMESVAQHQEFLDPSCPSGSGTVSGPYRYWWGTAFTFNHCLIQQLWTIVAIDGFTAGGVAIVCGVLSAGVCAIFGGLTAAYITTLVTGLNSADQQCGNRGANLNMPSVGLPFPNAIC